MFASPVPNLLSYWNHNKRKLDETKWSLCSFYIDCCSCHYQKIRGLWLVINLRNIFPLNMVIELWFHQATELDVAVYSLRS